MFKKFEPSDEEKEVSRRAHRLVYDHVPGPVYLDLGRVSISWSYEPRSDTLILVVALDGTRVYKEIDGEVYNTWHDGLPETIELLRKHMVLDDLADA